MSEKMGGFYYEVDIDTEKMLSGINRINAGVDSMEKHTDKASAAMDKAEKSANTLSTGLSKLASTIKVLISVAALKEMAGMVQKYQEMSERVKMATSSVSEFNEVQARLLKTANGTFRSLSEAQELYIATAASLRSMGYTTSQAIDVQDSMSYAFVKNATSADRAASAISAFSKSINTGKVSADQWETLTSAIPSVIDDIAAASGKSGAAVRALGSAGKLTAQELTEGLRQSLEANMTAATGMSNNLTDATVRLRTAITEVLVSFENQTGAIQGFTNGLISAADSILDFSRDSDSMKGATDAAVVGFGAVASVLAGRYTGAIYGATKSKFSMIAATVKNQAAEVNAAKAAIANADAEIKNAQATIQAEQAKARYFATQAAVNRQHGISVSYQQEHIQIQKAIATQEAIVQAATERKTAAVAAASVANRVYSASATLLKNGMALLGGPVGVISAVAAGWYLYQQNQAAARKESIAFADTLPEVIAKLKELNLEQARGKLADTSESIENQKEAIKGLKSEIDALNSQYQERIILAKQMGGGDETNNGHLKIAAQISRELAQKNRDLDSANTKLAQTQEGYSAIAVRVNEVMIDQMKAARDNANATKEAEKNATFLGGAHALLAQKLGASTQALQAFNAESLKKNWGGEAGEKLIKQARRRLELEKLTGEARERQQAAYDAEDAGVKDPQRVKELQDTAAETYRVRDARKENNKQATASVNATNEAAQALSRQQAQLDRLNTGYKQGSLELAQYDAVQALGSKATPQQIADAKAKAAAIYEQSKAVDKLAQSEQAARFIAQEMAARDTTVNPDTGRAADPTAQINQQEQQKLQALQNYQTIGAISVQQYEDAKTAIMETAAMQRKEILKREAEEHQQNMANLLGASSDFAGALAGAIGNAAGEASGAYKAMFAISKGFAIAQAGLNLQMAISNAMAVPWPLNIPAIAQALTAGTQVVNAISGANYGGGRKNGGSVRAGNLYEFGEGNLPEVLQMGGKSYMLPGNNGRVFSNKDVTSGDDGSPMIRKASTGLERLAQSSGSDRKPTGSQNGSIMVTVVIENNGTPQQVISQSTEKGITGDDVIRIITQDANEKGPILQSIMANTSATARFR